MEKFIKKRLVYLYNVQREKEKQIRILCRDIDAKVEKIRPEQTREPIGTLMGINVKKTAGEGEEINDEMMILCGFSDRELDGFLKGYKERNIDPIELKAVVTEHNILWSLEHLYKELKGERKGR